jgi:hypothetical protein
MLVKIQVKLSLYQAVEAHRICETSRLPYFLHSLFTDGGEVVRLTRQSPFTPRKIVGTHFC